MRRFCGADTLCRGTLCRATLMSLSRGLGQHRSYGQFFGLGKVWQRSSSCRAAREKLRELLSSLIDDRAPWGMVLSVAFARLGARSDANKGREAMDWFASAGRFCRIAAFSLILPAIAGIERRAIASCSEESPTPGEFFLSDESFRADPPVGFALNLSAEAAQALAQAPSPPAVEEPIAEAAANPLRESSSEVLYVASSQPVASPAASRAANAEKSAGTRRLVVSLFRPSEKQRDAQRPAAAATDNRSTSLFQRGKLLSGLTPKQRIMRYEDVARGAALVPVAPPEPKPGLAAPALTAPPAATSSAERAAADKAAEDQQRLERLPPVRRTPRPVLKPGTRLPQRPIELYPETGQ